MNATIYAYWNGQQIYDILNAVVLVTGGSQGDAYRQLMVSLALVAFMVSIGVGLAKLRATDTVNAFMALTFFYGIFFVPTTTVYIDDVRSGSNYTVSNVPYGLALFGGVTSHVGYWLTNTYETYFTAVDDEKFSKYGFLFGSRLVEQLPSQSYFDPTLRGNLTEFVTQCVNPELIDNPNSIGAMVKSNDLWTFISTPGFVNPGRISSYVDPTSGAVTVLSCDAAVTQLNTDTLAAGPNQLKYLGDKLHPGNPVSAALVGTQVQEFETAMLGVSRNAAEAVRHYAMINMVKHANENQAAGIFASTMAAAQLETSYFTMKTLAEGALPKIRNLIEALIYAVFPIVFLLVIAAGAGGGKVLAMYAMTAVWVQLWAPLFAVIHSLSYKSAVATTLQLTNSSGATIENMGHLLQMTVSDQAMAGLMVISVPAIALALVKGGAVAMSGVVNSVMSPSQATAAKTGGEVGLGNISGANVNYGGVNMNNSSVGNATHSQVRTAPTSLTGASSSAQRMGDGSTVTAFGNGAQAVDRAPTASNLGAVQASAGTALSQAASVGSKNSFQAGAESAGTSVSAANAAFETAKTHAQGNRNQTGVSSNASVGGIASFARMNDQLSKLASQWEGGKSVSEDSRRQILGEVAAQGGVGTPGGMILSAGLTTSLRNQNITSAGIQDLVKSAQSYAQSSGYSEQQSKAQQFGSTLNTDTGSASTREAARSIKASMQESQGAALSSKSSLSQAQGYEELAKREEGGGTQTKHDLANSILDQLGGGNRAEGNRILGGMSESQQHAMVAAYARGYAHDQAALLAPGNPEQNADAKSTAQGVTPTPGQPGDLYSDGVAVAGGTNTGNQAQVPGSPGAGPAIAVDGQTITPGTVREAVGAGGATATTQLNTAQSSIASGGKEARQNADGAIANPDLGGRVDNVVGDKARTELRNHAEETLGNISPVLGGIMTLNKIIENQFSNEGSAAGAAADQEAQMLQRMNTRK